MVCPVCGYAEMSNGLHSISYIYKGQKTFFDLHGDKCLSCGEVLLTKGEEQRMCTLMKEFDRQVNSELADPTMILSVRKKLNLDQRQAGVLFGGGANAFSRYECGKAKPPQTLMILLQMLDEKPEMLEWVKQCADRVPCSGRV